MQKVKKLKSFFTTVEFLGSFEAQIILLIFTFNLMAKPAALYFWSSIAFVNFTANELQALYADTRLSWT